MINTAIQFHFNQLPKLIRRIAVGICNEVYKLAIARVGDKMEWQRSIFAVTIKP